MLQWIAVAWLSTSLVASSIVLEQGSSSVINEVNKLRFVVLCEQTPKAGHLDQRGRTVVEGSDNPGIYWVGASSKPLIQGRGVYQAERTVLGILANSVDLTNNDLLARQILDSAIAFAVEKCPPHPDSKGYHGSFTFDVRHGDPASFVESKFSGGPDNSRAMFKLFDTTYPVKAIEASGRGIDDSKSDNWQAGSPTAILGPRFENLDTQRTARQAELTKQRELEASNRKILQQRQAAQLADAERAERARQLADQKESANRLTRRNKFASAFGVKTFVKMYQMQANPFVYQSQVIGMAASFEQMLSATEASFHFADAGGIVSGVPTNAFTVQGAPVMLAVRVVVKNGQARYVYVGSTPCESPYRVGQKCIEFYPEGCSAGGC